MVRWAVVAALCAITSAASAEDTIKIGDWSVGCNRPKADAFGDVKGKSSCWAQICANNIPFEIGNPGMFCGSIVRVDSSGLKFYQPKKVNPICHKSQTHRVAIDGRRIDNVDDKKKIELLTQGGLFLTEEREPWPECGFDRQGVIIRDFGQAYEAMMDKWKALKVGRP